MKSKGTAPIWHEEEKESEEEEPATEEVEEESEEASSEAEINLEIEVQHDTYESFADRLPNVKKVRNKLLIRRLTLIISIAVLIILVLVYFVSPLSKLSKITVSGNENINAETIIADSKLKVESPLWDQYWNRSVYEKNIVRTFPRVRKAVISFNGLNTFNVSIQEYEVVAIEASEGSYYPILENGKILPDKLENQPGGMPVFENFEDEEIIKNLMVSYTQLSDELKEKISEIKYAPSESNKDLVNLYMRDNNRVLVNISQLAEKMRYYEQVAAQMSEPGVIDMEVGIYSYSFETEKKNNEINESTDTSSQIVEEG
ncbi:FtsQ-type POTRA domain-containing protein [Enterococcus sp. BWB1-3]|uniref:cell division protein FtsQ/DivIB n=1 Tax=unclassified Enterococcus TaxID=2608891 RepID=UPI00192154BC|nr:MULTISPECIES: cell division protein FtsQ/DivIB [unclassified Enterococcus]MBL1227865.1 FtsQ-type POTRA domain-containing protein [Enterococcus sp. BWB1-3]MCB5953135.1 cell division protein FtsQ/DivIB [Enterococcus sp. BWT-B8]MCB5956163.1 cell division protein FtsQ/DivIB [Enterococcus sp. CWB-B31]